MSMAIAMEVVEHIPTGQEEKKGKEDIILQSKEGFIAFACCILQALQGLIEMERWAGRLGRMGVEGKQTAGGGRVRPVGE
jgi:hypothetical protein